jgi:hypothetical protein
VSEVGPDAAFESVGEGRVPTTVAGGAGGATVSATFTGEADSSDVASTGIGCVSEVGPDAASESVGEGRVPTTVAGGAGISIDDAFIGSVETTTGLDLAVDMGVRGAAMASSAFGVFTRLNEFGVPAGARALSTLAETAFDAGLLLDPRR